MYYEIIDASEWAETGDNFTGSGIGKWIQDPKTRRQCLAKYPRIRRNGNIMGIHWAEKVAAELANYIGIKCQKVDLGIVANTPVALCEKFTIKRTMRHGYEVLGVTRRPIPEKQYSFSVVLPKIIERGKLNQFLEMIVFDALIGNRDRHESNWGFLIGANGEDLGFAPLFDNGTAFGVELGIQQVKEKLESREAFEKYLANGTQKISWGAEGRLTHFETVRRLLKQFPNETQTALSKLLVLNTGVVESIVGQIPDDWMHGVRKELAIKLTMCRLERLIGGGRK